MSVTHEYREFALEQLQRVVPVTTRNMFGGGGILKQFTRTKETGHGA